MYQLRESGLSIGQTRRRRACCSFLCAALAALTISVEASAQEISVSPDDQTVFSFSGPEGGPFAPQSLTTWALENVAGPDAPFVVTSNQLWLTVTPSQGSVGGLLNNPVEIVAQLDVTEAQSLAAGVYTATVSFKNLANGVGDTERTVRLEVAPANFSVSPAFVSVTATLNGSNPADKVVTLTNSGQVDLNYQLTWDEHPWISISKSGGTVTGGGADSFTVSFNIAGLAAGTYTDSIQIGNTTNGAGSRTISVSLTVKAKDSSAVTLKPDQDIEITGAVGELPLLSQQSTIINDGERTVRWSALVSAPWISVSPSSGDLAPSDGAPGGLDERVVTIRVNAAVQTLPPGSAAATATFQSVTTLTTGEFLGVAFGTRVVHVVANPVLTLTSPAIGGVVTTAPDGLVANGSTETTQRLIFDFGEVVVVTATPGNGYEFRGWAGDFPEDSQLVNPLILPMDASKSLGALIAPILRTLTLSLVGGGTGTIVTNPTGLQIDNPLESKYNNGTTVQLTATADAGSVFRGWSGNVPQGSELDNPMSVLLDRDRVISARFEPALDLTIHIVGDGTVTVDPDLPSYAAGMLVTLSAVPDDGAHFAGWSGAASGSTDSISITLTGDTEVTATFATGSDPGNGNDNGNSNGNGNGNDNTGNDNIAKLTVEVQGDGLVTPNGGNYVKGATVTVIATPTVSSKFVRWEESASGVALTATVVMDSDKTVRAVFEASTDQPVDRPTPSGGGSSTCGATGMLGLAGMFFGWVSLALVSRRHWTFR